jgi:N-acetylmuramoyl-L-alanine amidase
VVPYVIGIDPGHGGSPSSTDSSVLWDPGVVAGTVMEKDITLDLAFRLRKLLQAERVKVIMTRTTDQYVEISQRWNMVHAGQARIFVSLHVNAFEGDPSINGSTVFYPRDDSIPLARAIEQDLSTTLVPFGIKDDGIAPKPELWVHSDVPTATIEPAYMTNPRELALLQRDDFRQAIAQGVFAGLLATDPQIEAAKKVLDARDAQAAREHAAEVLAAAARRMPTGILNPLWLVAGSVIVLLLLIRGFRQAPAGAMAPRRRASRRLQRRRRELTRPRELIRR